MSGTKKKKGAAIFGTSRGRLYIAAVAIFACATAAYAIVFIAAPSVEYSRAFAATSTAIRISKPQLNKADYDKRMWLLANNGTSTIPSANSTTSPHYAWPVKAAYPNAGALLPFHRIVAYYGNFYSTGMGVLGQYPPEIMIEKLKAAVAEWNAADPSTPVMPAIDYIAITAQEAPVDGTYRARMPSSQIDIALEPLIAKCIKCRKEITQIGVGGSCPKCGSMELDIVGGIKVTVEGVE